ncbi:Stabilin-2 [Escovopsis weberi]|uniref:Stabilin-2 n=1 Tax=Escovopsis weberi TaxID=150374 RepID=A0A0M8N5I2_ESCWE|nr:Stabilin-2 [Escovopsis weberi]
MARFLYLVGLLGLAAAADQLKDLGAVLSSIKELSTYNELIHKYPDILLQLPSYNGIIAPSNDAFKNIPYTALNGIWDPENKNITVPLLQYHVLKGTVRTSDLQLGPTVVRPTLLTDPRYTNVTGGQNVLIDIQPGGESILTTSLGNRCTITDPDIPFQGGVIQVVDHLLIPPPLLNVTAQTFKLESFLGALYASDLMPAVQDEARDVTIFAPMDRAMALVGGTLDKLDAKQLARVMGYHVVQGKVIVSSALNNGSRFDTMASSGSGADAILVRQFGNNKYINSAPIVQPDILLANGIMHIIAGVLNPMAAAVIPNATAVSQSAVFPISSERNPFTSALPCTTNCPVPTSPAAHNATSTTSIFTSRSKAGAEHHQAVATGHVMIGAALGVLALI